MEKGFFIFKYLKTIIKKKQSNLLALMKKLEEKQVV